MSEVDFEGTALDLPDAASTWSLLALGMTGLVALRQRAAR